MIKGTNSAARLSRFSPSSTTYGVKLGKLTSLCAFSSENGGNNRSATVGCYED